MAEVTINLTGASPYYREWRQEFVTDLTMNFPGRVMENDKEIQVVAGRHSTQISVDKVQDDVNVHISTMSHGGGGGINYWNFIPPYGAILLLWRMAIRVLPVRIFRPLLVDLLHHHCDTSRPTLSRCLDRAYITTCPRVLGANNAPEQSSARSAHESSFYGAFTGSHNRGNANGLAKKG